MFDERAFIKQFEAADAKEMARWRSCDRQRALQGANLGSLL